MHPSFQSVCDQCAAKHQNTVNNGDRLSSGHSVQDDVAMYFQSRSYTSDCLDDNSVDSNEQNVGIVPEWNSSVPQCNQPERKSLPHVETYQAMQLQCTCASPSCDNDRFPSLNFPKKEHVLIDVIKEEDVLVDVSDFLIEQEKSNLIIRSDSLMNNGMNNQHQDNSEPGRTSCQYTELCPPIDFQVYHEVILQMSPDTQICLDLDE